jgi:hypothetical protein
MQIKITVSNWFLSKLIILAYTSQLSIRFNFIKKLPRFNIISTFLHLHTICAI